MSFSGSLEAVVEQSLGSANHHSYVFISRSFAEAATPTDFVRLLLKKLAGLSLFGEGQKVSDEEFWEAFARHPDLLRADAERSILRKDDVELFRERTLYPPTFARRRFLLIERAERMNNQSANALLKTLEEPLAQCVFVLTTSRPHSLPSTITSRCQKIPLPAWSDAGTSACAGLEKEDVHFLEIFFSAAHLQSPPNTLPADTLSTQQKINLPAKVLSDLAQWCDAAGRKYPAQLLRDAVVEKTSAALLAGQMCQSRATLTISEINRWADMDPFNPTNSFWLMRILLTLAD
ncbi:MAG: hypothetical protein RLZZ488_2710 [Pseudomonadota bacterium]|jgi:hypothetical protein